MIYDSKLLSLRASEIQCSVLDQDQGDLGLNPLSVMKAHWMILSHSQFLSLNALTVFLRVVDNHINCLEPLRRAE